jgi:hypothetical protein
MRAVLAATAAALLFAAPAQAGEILLVAGCNDAAGARGFGSCLLGDDASAPPRLVSREVAGGGFTPDGRGIVGETSGTAPGGFGNIATVQLDGTGYRLILDTPSEAFGIRPSPDGRSVAYWLFGGLDQPGVVRVVSADGSGDRQLGRGGFPRWLRGSDGIVYAGADEELHSVGLDGSGERTITRGQNLLEAAVSPDGRRVAFSALMADGTQALHVMDADGSAARRLTSPAGQDTTPIWAPDSRALLFNRTASLADGVVRAAVACRRRLRGGRGSRRPRSRAAGPRCQSSDRPAFAPAVLGLRPLWRRALPHARRCRQPSDDDAAPDAALTAAAPS